MNSQEMIDLCKQHTLYKILVHSLRSLTPPPTLLLHIERCKFNSLSNTLP